MAPKTLEEQLKRSGGLIARLGAAPLSLRIASTVIGGQTVVIFALGPSLLNGASIVVAGLILLAMLVGSRIAWAIALIGAIGQVASPFISTDDYWSVAVGLLSSMLLLAPRSTGFMFSDASSQRRNSVGNGKRGRAIGDWAYGAIARIANWELAAAASPVRRSYAVLIWRLGIACIVLLLAVGATYSWENGAGEGSGVVSAIARVTWLCYVIVQITFIMVSLIALLRDHVPTRVQPGPNPRRSK